MSVDDHKGTPAPVTATRRKGRGKRIALVGLALVVMAGGGWAGWSVLMPMYQGRDDPYSELPSSEALLDSRSQKTSRLGDVVTKQSGYHYSTNSWTRWTSNAMADAHLEVTYILHSATSTDSGRAAAEALLDDQIAHSKASFVAVEELSDVGDEAVETWAGSIHDVYVRSGNVSVHVEYGAYRVKTDSEQHEQIQQTARQLAALAVEDIEEENS